MGKNLSLVISLSKIWIWSCYKSMETERGTWYLVMRTNRRSWRKIGWCITWCTSIQNRHYHGWIFWDCDIFDDRSHARWMDRCTEKKLITRVVDYQLISRHIQVRIKWDFASMCPRSWKPRDTTWRSWRSCRGTLCRKGNYVGLLWLWLF